MSSKVDRAAHDPSWTEVIIGALLSLVLGIAVGAVLLIVKPVVVAKDVPKEPTPGTVYYVEGNRGDPSRARQVLAKRDTLAQGQTVKLTEDEINAVIASATAKPATKPAGDAPDDAVAAGTPIVRIRGGVMQVGVPITVNLLGFQQRIIAQARGGFEKDGNVFVYEPDELYFGSCPVQRLPLLSSYIKHQLLASHPVPDDLAAAWAKLSNVSVEGNTLVLSM